MKRRHFLGTSTGLLAFGVLGCGDDDAAMDSGPSTDSSTASDTGPIATDTGGSDTGPTEDTGPMDDAGPADAGNDAGPMCVSVSFEVSEDHPMPHAEGIEFPAADVIAGVEVTYDITGASRHPHTLVVTPEHFAALAAGESVTITSSFDARHTHEVTLTCMNS